MSLFDRVIRELGKLAFLVWLVIVHALAAMSALLLMVYPGDTTLGSMMVRAMDGGGGRPWMLFMAFLIVCAPTATLYLIMGGARDFWDRARGRNIKGGRQDA